jgi:pyruvate carboxylase subunit B
MNDFIITINNKKRQIKIVDDNTLLIDGKKTNFELTKLSNGTSILNIDNKVYEVSQKKSPGDNLNLLIDGRIYETISRTSLQEKASNLLEIAESLHSHKVVVKAPMPGMILKINKKQGELVEKGDSIIILEAMKMENEIKAPASGIITELNISEGKAVEKNSFLFSIE